jgi:hypothetical protein
MDYFFHNSHCQHVHQSLQGGVPLFSQLPEVLKIHLTNPITALTQEIGCSACCTQAARRISCGFTACAPKRSLSVSMWSRFGPVSKRHSRPPPGCVFVYCSHSVQDRRFSQSSEYFSDSRSG